MTFSWTGAGARSSAAALQRQPQRRKGAEDAEDGRDKTGVRWRSCGFAATYSSRCAAMRAFSRRSSAGPLRLPRLCALGSSVLEPDLTQRVVLFPRGDGAGARIVKDPARADASLRTCQLSNRRQASGSRASAQSLQTCWAEAVPPGIAERAIQRKRYPTVHAADGHPGLAREPVRPDRRRQPAAS